MKPHVFEAQLRRVSNSDLLAVLVAAPAGGGEIVACGTLIAERRVLRPSDGWCQHQPLTAHIEDVVVDEKLRGSGIGKQVIRCLLEIAAEAGCDTASLNCTPGLLGAF